MPFSHFERPQSPYPAPGNTHILGICTGAFATAAISTSQDIAALVPAGVLAAIQAFRTALHSLKLQRDLEKAQSSIGNSWSAVVGLSEQHAAEVIEKYAVNTVWTAFSELLERTMPIMPRPFHGGIVHS